MKRKILLLTLVILILLFLKNCTHFGWESYKAEGLAPEHYDVLVNRDDSVFYIGGRSSKHFFNKEDGKIDSSINKTILYYSLDYCRTWKEIIVNHRGNVSNLHVEGDTFVIANQFLQMPSSILYSTNQGNSWVSIMEIESKQYIQDISINNELGVIVALRGDSILNVLSLKEGNIDTLITFPASHYYLELLDTKAFFITRGKDKAVIVFDYKTKDTNKFKLPDIIRVVSKGTDNQGNLLIVAEEDKDHHAVYRVNNKIKRIDLGKYSEYRINRVSGNSKRIYLDVHQKGNMSILGISHELIYSEDNGDSWSQEDYPISLSTKPYSPLYDGGYLTYTAFGKFQRLK